MRTERDRQLGKLALVVDQFMKMPGVERGKRQLGMIGKGGAWEVVGGKGKAAWD